VGVRRTFTPTPLARPPASRYCQPVRRFLGHPTGWTIFQVVEFALVVVMARRLRSAFPEMSQGVLLTLIIGVALALAVANYVIRRKYLQPDED
jgi:hypothetical protein